MRRMWTIDERTRVIDHYGRLGATALGFELGRSPDSVSSQARRHGLVSCDYRKRQARTRVGRSKSVNINFFEADTPEMVYVLGYIWACGSVKTKHRKTLRLVCPYGETKGMRKVREMMSARHLIQTNENTHVLEICNSLLVEQLVARFGMPPGRRRDALPPAISPHHMAAFAGGHLLATGTRNAIHVSWCGHPAVVDWLRGSIASQAGVPPGILYSATARPSVRWADPASVRAIGAWLGEWG